MCCGSMSRPRNSLNRAPNSRIESGDRSPLLQTPPADVAQVISAHGIADTDVLIAARTDIDLLGRYRDHWLLVTKDKLAVFADGVDPALALSIGVRDASEYRTQVGVGSGLLQARIDGAYVDVLRYSNRRAFWFEKIAAKLDRHLRGEAIEVHDDEQVDPRRCGHCGIMLEHGGDSCPRCVSKGTVLIRMIKLMRPYRGAAMIMMMLLLLGISLDLVAPQLSRYLVDHVLPGNAQQAAEWRAAPARITEHLQMLLTLVFILVGVNIVRMSVNLLNGRLGSRIGTAITHDMRGRLVAHLQQLSVGFYDRQQVGSLVGRVAYDTDALQGFINQLTSGFLLQVLMI